MFDLGIDRLNKVNLCKDCFNSDLRFAATIDQAILHPSPYMIISIERGKMVIGKVFITHR